MKKQFCLSLFSVDIPVALITMFLLIMVPSSTDGIKITVKADQNIFNESNQITVVVQDSTTVKVLKEMINNCSGIEPKRQKLQLKNPDGTAIMLVNRYAMKHYKIEENSAVLLFKNFQIKVNADEKFVNGDDALFVEVNGTDTVKDLKNKIIQKLPENIVTKYGSDLERLTLQYGENDNDVLNDEKRIDFYPIKEGDIVHLSICEFLVEVKQFGKKNEKEYYSVCVNSKETVAILKKKIKNKTGVEPEEQILKCNTKNGPFLEDKNTLKNYGIENSTTTIILSINFVITVMADEQIFKKGLTITNTITVKMIGTDTVEDLKNKIIGTMTEKTKTKLGSDHKRLTLKYVEDDDYDVLNDGETLDYYQIKKSIIVHLSIGEFQIVVRYETKTYAFWMKSEENVAILKKKIKNQSGIEPDDQILKVGPNGDGGTVAVLEDEKTMANYGIGEGTTVLLFIEFKIGVKYKKDNEKKTFSVRMKGTDNVLDLKKKIMEKIKNVFPGIESVKINDRESSAYDKELNENIKTLKACGIGEGSTIYLVHYYEKHSNVSTIVKLM